MSENPPTCGKNSSESPRRELKFWIARLNSLIDGEDASRQLILFGDAAIPALRDFLLSGRPSGIYQPRQWAVQALASLGAKEVLLEYLAREDRNSDPVIREGEDAVCNTAARLVSCWKTEDVFRTLFTLSEKRLLPGAIFALGEFQRPGALAVLDRALEDDVAGPSAEEALLKFGHVAAETLVSSALRKRMNQEQESPSSLRRRRAAVKILADTGLGRQSWPELRVLLDERDPELVVHAARLAVTASSEQDKQRALRSLLRVLPEAQWYLREDAASSLGSLYSFGANLIEQEIARRLTKPSNVRASDGALIVLLRLRARGGRAG